MSMFENAATAAAATTASTIAPSASATAAASASAAEAAATGATSEAAAAAADSGSSFYYGFDWDAFLPWRTGVAGDVTKVFASHLQPPGGSDPAASMLGVWSDGHVHPVPDVTRAMWQNKGVVLRRPASALKRPAGAATTAATPASDAAAAAAAAAEGLSSASSDEAPPLAATKVLPND